VAQVPLSPHIPPKPELRKLGGSLALPSMSLTALKQEIRSEVCSGMALVVVNE